MQWEAVQSHANMVFTHVCDRCFEKDLIEADGFSQLTINRGNPRGRGVGETDRQTDRQTES